MDVLGFFIAFYFFLDLISQDKVYGWIIIGCISCLGSHGYCENFNSHFLFFYIFSVAKLSFFFFFFFFLIYHLFNFFFKLRMALFIWILACVQRGHKAWILGKIQRKNRQLRNYTALTQARPLMIGSLFSLSLIYIYVCMYVCMYACFYHDIYALDSLAWFLLD